METATTRARGIGAKSGSGDKWRHAGPPPVLLVAQTFQKTDVPAESSCSPENPDKFELTFKYCLILAFLSATDKNALDLNFSRNMHAVYIFYSVVI